MNLQIKKLIDIVDSSGMRFFYVNAPREHDAGVLYMGHSVVPLMIIPPGANNYTISGICGAQCTERVRHCDVITSLHNFTYYTQKYSISLKLASIFLLTCYTLT